MMKEAAEGMAVKISDGLVPIGCDNQGAIKLIASGVVRVTLTRFRGHHP